MYKNTVITGFMLVILTSCNCSSDKKTINYANSEIERNEEVIIDILNAISIEHSQIYCIPHFRYGTNEISKKLSSESFNGQDFDPQGPAGQEYKNDSHSSDSQKNQYSKYKRFDLTANYDSNGNESLRLDYISYLILLDKQYEDKTDVLDEALSELILNRERDDTLTIQIK